MRGRLFLLRRNSGKAPALMPWQFVAAETWHDCACPLDTGGHHRRPCRFPDCQLSERFGDLEAGHDPRNHEGRLCRLVSAFDCRLVRR